MQSLRAKSPRVVTQAKDQARSSKDAGTKPIDDAQADAGAGLRARGPVDGVPGPSFAHHRSKATKAYWKARIEMLEQELMICQGDAPMEEEVDKPTGDGDKPLKMAINLDPDGPAGAQTSRPKSKPKVSAKTVQSSTMPGANPKKKGQKIHALTDHEAPFPTMSTKWSEDLTINAICSLQHQLFVYK